MHLFLETERLLLRRLTLEDVDHLLRLDSDPDVIRFTNPGGRCAPREVYETEILPRFLAYYERDEGYGYWAAVEKSGQEFLGWFHFRPARDESGDIELGYRLLSDARNKGYASEASRALIRHGFTELGVRRVVATALADNLASRRVMEKAGLTFERDYVYRFTDPITEQVAEHPAVRYALERPDWRETSVP